MTTMTGLWLLAVAWASEPEAQVAPASEPEPEPAAVAEDPADAGAEEQTLEERLEALAEVVEVHSDTTFERLSRTLRGLGYKEGKVRRRGTVFRPETSWYPSVWLTPDGGVRFSRTPPKVTLPVLGGEVPLQGGCVGGLPMASAPTGRVGDQEGQSNLPARARDLATSSGTNPLLCLDPAAAVVADRRMNPKKRRVLEAAEDDLRQWQGAVMQQSFVQTLMAKWQWMQELWASDQPAADRRAALLEHWCTRTDTPEGQQARALVEKYFVDVVQASGSPLTDAEVAWVRSECRGEWPLSDAPDAPEVLVEAP